MRGAGAPRRFTDVQQAQVKALACELPADRGIPLSRFSHADLAAEAAEAVDVGVVEDISASTVRRWLRRHQARVFGRTEPTTGIVPFANLVAQVMTHEPYANADRVFFIVDNGSSHRGQKAIDRLRKAWPNATLVHTPIHASWVNQVEIYFSIVQRKVVTPNDFYDLTDVTNRLTAFEELYNLAARPFNWRYTRTGLDTTLKRITAHGTATF